MSVTNRDESEIADSGCREKLVSKKNQKGDGGDGCHALKSAEIEGRGDCSTLEYISQAGERCQILGNQVYQSVCCHFQMRLSHSCKLLQKDKQLLPFDNFVFQS